MRPPAPFAADSPDEIEARFYAALQQADLDALMALWADDDEIVCVHPGGPRVVGTAAIRASFEAIFAHNAIPVEPQQARRLQAMGAAVHHLVERIAVRSAEGEQVAWVLATNVYLKTAQGWRMVAHHASPAGVEPPPAEAQAPAVLH